jgi:hypothetical protein
MYLTPRRSLAAAPIALALTLSVAIGATAQVATLSSPDETPAPDAAAVTELEFADREEALLAFVQCLRDNGLDVDDPVAGEGGGGRRILGDGPGGSGDLDPQSEEFQTAQVTCGPILEAARPDFDPVVEQERLESELLLAQCLRDNGYPEYPDPALDNDGRLQRGGQGFQTLGIDRRSEGFQNARGTCADDLGVEQFGPGGGPGGRGGN